MIVFLGSLLLVPGSIEKPAPSSLLSQFTVLGKPRLLLLHAITAFGYGGSFTAFTYLAPILVQISGFEASAVGVLMLIYGVSVAFGNVWGGKLADRKGPVRALQIIFAGLAGVLLLLTFTAASKWLVMLTVLMWGAVAFGNLAGLQLYVVQQAQRATPHAVEVASGLNIAAFNVGIAFESWVGGIIVAKMGIMATPWIGALIVLRALVLTTWSGALERQAGYHT